MGHPPLHAHHFQQLCKILFYSVLCLLLFVLKDGAAGCILVEIWVLFPLDLMLIESLFVSGELSWGGEDAAMWSLGISAGQQRRGRPV